jgi:type I restriction enzyme M protein
VCRSSAHFEKVKNQNVLRDTDIDRIVAAYRYRNETEKFSHRASMDEIAQNEYNLNIPRYVDTFEEEAMVDLDAVLAELKTIDADMAGVDETIAGYCKSLGLEFPA